MPFLHKVTPPAKRLRILGIRGVPAAHGGFETFAEQLSLYLTARGWDVTVYCQEDGEGPITEDKWGDVRRVHIPVQQEGPLGTIMFDWQSTIHAGESGELCLTLGYNTAVFCGWLRMKGVTNLINMDGIEWKRAKWGRVAKTWFWLNDWLGCWLGDHLIADHPEMKKHLSTRVSPDKIAMIAYGAPTIESASLDPIRSLGLEPDRYFTVIARPEPENSILEIVKGFSSKPRGMTLAVLGKYDGNLPYHHAVMEAAGPEVRFLGPIYNQDTLASLRFHSLAYVHGHQVGGTNPSLVEALGAGNAVIAQDNRFNRWVAGDGAVYFRDAVECSLRFDQLLQNPDQVSQMREASRQRHTGHFQWDMILSQYERLLEAHMRKAPQRHPQVPSTRRGTIR
jgi:glycosyltransferase involved in cell wall biosynthesis